MNRPFIYILMCILCLGCAKLEGPDVLEVVGDDVRTVIIGDLYRLGESTKGLNINLPEVNSMMKLRGVDFYRVAAISYSPSKSAIVISMLLPKVVRKSLGDPLLSDSVASIYAASGNTYFVTDNSILWMVDSFDGPEGALEKVSELRAYAKKPLTAWKRERLASYHLLSFLTGYGSDFVYGELNEEKARVDFNAWCLDSVGNSALWLPSDDWQILPRDLGRIDPRNDISLAIGEISLTRALSSLPKGFNVSRFRGFFDGIEKVGPINIAFNGLDAFRITICTPEFSASEKISEKLEDLSNFAPGLKIERTDSTVIIETSRNAPSLFGTSYTGCNLAFVVNINSEEMEKIMGEGVPGLNAAVVMHGATLDGYAAFSESRESFIHTLLRLLLD